MSIVSVHGPLTFGSKAAASAGPVKATVNPSNGLIWNFQISSPSNRPAADFDWAFPGGTPTSKADDKGPVAVTYSTAGAKTATLTVSGASTDAPANGSYPITVQAVAGVAPLMMQQQSAGGEGGEMSDSTPYVTPQTSEEAPAPEEAPAAESPPEGPPPSEEYDPADHTVDEVKTHAEGLSDDEIRALIDQEIAGKNRVTLVSALEDMLPYDPGAHTVDEVVAYAETNPDEVQAILDAERAGKNRSTLVPQLEALLA